MRFWTAYAFIALGIATKAWSSTEGHGHAPSITSLIAPTFNVAVLFGVLIYVLKDKLKSYFVSHSENIANTLDRANIKAKEAKSMLENQQQKMASLEADIKNIHGESETDVVVFEKNLSKETEDKIAKLKIDANSKVEADKKQMINALNTELLEQVIKKTKSTIKENKENQSKVTAKMLQGLQ
jgi:F0F1-type ATP synthase membrane subunit b/b'